MGLSSNGEPLKTYHGVAACDLADDSRELEVYCQEFLPFYQGGEEKKLDGYEYNMNIKTKGADGLDYQSQIPVKNTFKCITFICLH